MKIVANSILLSLALLTCCCVTNTTSAGIVLGVEENSNASKIVQTATEQIRAGKLEAARTTLLKLAAEPNQVHHELVLAGLLLDNGLPLQAKQTLERFSAYSGPRFDLFVTYGKLALAEKRWFDAFVHSQMADNQEMPKTWTRDFKAKMQDEVDILALTAIAARGSWEHANKVARKRALSAKTNPKILEFAARASYKLENPTEAFRIYGLIESVFPKGPSALTRLALLHQEDQDIEQATKLHQQAISANPQDPHAHLEYARWLLANEDAEQARKMLYSLAKIDGIDGNIKTEGKYLLAVLDRLDGDLGAARKKLEQLHKATPDGLPIANQLALVLIESSSRKDKERALELAEANQASYSGNPEVWATLGWIQFNLGMLEEAERSFAVASSTGNVNRDTAFFIAQLKLKQGKNEEAEALLKQTRESTGPFFYASRL